MVNRFYVSPGAHCPCQPFRHPERQPENIADRSPSLRLPQLPLGHGIRSKPLTFRNGTDINPPCPARNLDARRPPLPGPLQTAPTL